MSNQPSIAAGIVLYNPDVERLKQNIIAIRPQVAVIYVVDNASANAKEIDQLLTKFGLYAVRNTCNMGIASALNQLMRQAQEQGMEWLLTLDQDSVCSPDLIAKLSAHISKHTEAGILCPVICDRSFGVEHHPSPTQTTSIVKECITSASLTRIAAWHQVGGFDERLFIDAVDTDFCLSLHEHGWQTIQVNAATLMHEIGHEATQHIVFGRSYIAFNHVPIRYYYIARNMVFLSRKHQGFLPPAPWRCMCTMMARMLVILLWERHDRWYKCVQILRGMRDGCRMSLN